MVMENVELVHEKEKKNNMKKCLFKLKTIDITMSHAYVSSQTLPHGNSMNEIKTKHRRR